ncbi:hypothetical protein E3N88_38095 [Mikania micrantha]|uniref:Uncharacterized protein n=1 Tax=Mikania micrantha TaxID=192012 RepID=A0A5N6LT04_9ASTR|nr:hypothetical protein E3N88_38095 [Mikania micrantha]
MLGLLTFTNTPPISLIPITNPIPKQPALFPSIKTLNLSRLNSNRENPRGFKASFSENKEELSEKQDGNGEEDDDLKKNKGGDERPRFNLRWTELLFDPDPDNVVAVGLTGVLAWASVQVLWQLFVISFAILIAAVKSKKPSWWHHSNAAHQPSIVVYLQSTTYAGSSGNLDNHRYKRHVTSS